MRRDDDDQLVAGIVDAGRIDQLIGRNKNVYLTFAYTWDGGNAGAGGKVASMTVTAESGLAAVLTFSDFGSHRLLASLTWPDGTVVAYNYDASGDLITAKLPPNNTAGTSPAETYTYATAGGSFQYMSALATPRWNADDNGS